MTPSDWIYLIACMGHLALCLLVLLRGAKNPLAPPLGLLCLDLFVWNFAGWAHRFSQVPIWRHIDLFFHRSPPPYGCISCWRSWVSCARCDGS